MGKTIRILREIAALSVELVLVLLKPKAQPPTEAQRMSGGPLYRQVVDRYGHGIATFLQNRFSQIFRDIGRDPCVNCVRVADASNRQEMAEYERIKANGCCGSIDRKFYDKKSGRTFWLGCNYGH